ncbi:MAG: hypothetical protein A3J28_00465 [Acidobacteria bacterium RIFCSPLOWO2_12_FULL_60_22]|nr:MAG: hypothetical protein A3J28_00465 [Acidobacteria bacterium RIFCSPLOWO2_12_FULL_60_22]
MIFGFNTDVTGKDAVYHVQTEDRGAKHPVIDSIIYLSGRIVDRRQTSYDPSQVIPAQIEEMVRKQHKELVDAIRAGTFVPTGNSNSTNPPNPSGYTIELLNGADLCRDGQLCFELAVRENGKNQAPHNVSLELRWVVAGAVSESRTAPLGEDGRAGAAFAIPTDHHEAVLLVRAQGPAGKEFSKFRARSASEPV